MEIGGYIEFENFNLPMLHEDAIKLNCGRCALEYVIKAKDIHRIFMPRFMCDSCDNTYKKLSVDVCYYSINMDFTPCINDIAKDEWIYVVNFYGQLSNEYIVTLKKTFNNLIIDNAQAYFQMPVMDVDTIYTCRKFFGVSDGAILYTNKILDKKIEQDESFSRMKFLLGRFERTASEFYLEYIENNKLFKNENIKLMSKLTENLLHGIDYEYIKYRRTSNFKMLDAAFNGINKLKLSIPEGAFMYPLYIENGDILRKKLQKEKIYIPTLWPAVFNICKDSELEYDMAKNILPLPCDQRYGEEEMVYMMEVLLECID